MSQHEDIFGYPPGSISSSAAESVGDKIPATGRKELCLQKGDQCYVFRYVPGDEEAVLDAFIELANSPETSDNPGNADRFDWFDAAVLSFQLSKNLVEEAEDLLTGF